MQADLTSPMLKQLRDEKAAIDTIIAALEDLLQNQAQARTRGKDKREFGQTSGRRTPEKQRVGLVGALDPATKRRRS